MALVPYVVEQTNRGERSYDIFSTKGSDLIFKYWSNPIQCSLFINFKSKFFKHFRWIIHTQVAINITSKMF